MTPALRDALAAARINRLKTRMARAWRERQSVEFPVCQDCGARHVPGLGSVLRALGWQEDDAPAVPPTTHLN